MLKLLSRNSTPSRSGKPTSFPAPIKENWSQNVLSILCSDKYHQQKIANKFKTKFSTVVPPEQLIKKMPLSDRSARELLAQGELIQLMEALQEGGRRLTRLRSDLIEASIQTECYTVVPKLLKILLERKYDVDQLANMVKIPPEHFTTFSSEFIHTLNFFVNSDFEYRPDITLKLMELGRMLGIHEPKFFLQYLAARSHLKDNNPEEALRLLPESNMNPEELTLMIKCLLHQKQPDGVIQYLTHLAKEGSDQLLQTQSYFDFFEYFTANGDLDRAYALLQYLKQTDIASMIQTRHYHALMCLCGIESKPKTALALYQEMVKKQMVDDDTRILMSNIFKEVLMFSSKTAFNPYNFSFGVCVNHIQAFLEKESK